MIRPHSSDDMEPADTSRGPAQGQDPSPLLDAYWEALRHESDSDLRRRLIEQVPAGDSLSKDLEFLKLLHRLRAESVGNLDATSTSTKVLPHHLSVKDPSRPNDGETGVVQGIENDSSVDIPPRIGKYQVLERLGAGGQSQVFRVFDPELRRDAALKLENQPIDHSERSHIAIDGQRLAELEHPNIVKVYHLDSYEGRPYLVMEYIRGRSLDQYAREGPVTPRQAAALVSEIAGAVAFAHRLLIVHQDIKPQNILIDNQGRPKLIDFGLSRLNDAWQNNSPDIGGTRAYMSPEQAKGHTDLIGPQTDVFGLGSVLYHLLTDGPLYRGASPESTLWYARNNDYIPVRQIAPNVPRSLERICHKSLARDPDQRYASADELRRALRRFLGKRWIAAACLLALVLITAAWFAPRPSTPPENHAPAPSPIPHAEPPSQSHPTIVDFKVDLYRGEKDLTFLGRIGSTQNTIRYNDSVRISAKLEPPSYFYLIAFNTNGHIQFCDQSTTEPTPTAEAFINYPRDQNNDPERTNFFVLNDGPGVQGFVLVVSSEPLPSYEKWQGREGLEPCWESDTAKTVWFFNGNAIEPLESGPRGEPRKGRIGHPAKFLKVCQYLKKRSDVAVIQGIAFPVMP